MPFLDWVNKAQATQIAAAVPYHLLEFQSAHGDGNAENLLIQGDNLLALKALLPFYRGQVKCIYIDPPYNTQHYDDKLEHSQWLSMMHPRLVLLRELLTEDGSIWVSIDDREAHYLKVLMDEVFGRGNFVVNVLWQKRTSPDARLKIGDAHEHVLLYARMPDRLEFNLLGLTDEQKSKYKNPDLDPRGPWVSSDYSAQGFRPNQMYEIGLLRPVVSDTDHHRVCAGKIQRTNFSNSLPKDECGLDETGKGFRDEKTICQKLREEAPGRGGPMPKLAIVKKRKKKSTSYAKREKHSQHPNRSV